MTHTPPPIFCHECAGELEALIANGENVDGGYCPHHGTLAVVRVADGRIKKWTLTGPYTEAQAEASIAAIRATGELKAALAGALKAETVAQKAIAKAARH
jgi:hypothetical protein